MLQIFNYLGDIFNGPTGEESASRGEGLKFLTPNQMHYLKLGNNLYEHWKQ